VRAIKYAPGLHGVERFQRFARRARSRQDCPDAVARLRPLHRDHRQVAPRGQLELRGTFGDKRAEPGEVLVGRSGVDDQAEPVFAQEIDDQVVEHAAVGTQQAGVKRLARYGQLVDIVGECAAQEVAYAALARRRVARLDVDRKHVRDIEHPRAAAHRVMLVDLRAVVHRHVPAAEIDHPGAGSAMNGMERGLLEQHASQAARRARP
jgi:hypothetical protein